MPLEEYVGSMSEDEIDYMDVYRTTWEQAGMRLPDDLLLEIFDVEQQCWDRAVRVDPDAKSTLEWLGERGVLRALCSNAPFPADMMRRQVTSNGLDQLVDASIFSSDVGKRKPAPEMYLAALEAVGADAEHAFFVGDRVREDYEGPRALGMRAVVVTRHAEPEPRDGVPTITSLAELPALL